MKQTSKRAVAAGVVLLAWFSVASTATGAQVELRAPWRGTAVIGQGNHGPVSHNVCGSRTLQPNNCNWENTFAIDIDIPYGSDVLAAADGEVTYASDDISPSGGREMAVTSTGPDGTVTVHVYMHLSAILIYSGHVSVGQTIAKSGASSDGSEYGTQPHLHFHVWAGFGSRDSHTVPIQNLLMKRSGVDATFRRYDETNGDLEHYTIVGGTFESNNGNGTSSTSGTGSGGFTIGARVAAAMNSPDGNPVLVIGDQGTVTCLFPAGTNYDVMVDWDKDVSGSSGIGSCAGTTRPGHGWAVKDAWITVATGSGTSGSTSAAPRIDSINPPSIPPNTPIWLTVNGANIQNGFTATAAGYAIASAGLKYNSSNQVMVEVTMGGSNYSTTLVIRNPDGQTATGNFQVTGSTFSGTGSGGFTIGARVAAAMNAPDGNPVLLIGDQGTVTCLFPAGTNYDVMVDWDKDVSGSSGIGSCAGTTRPSHGWAVKDAWITLVTGSVSSGSTALAPRIDYINPSSVLPNTPTWLTVNGANFQSGFTATAAGYAIATPGLKYNGPSQVMVEVTMGGSNYSTTLVIRNPDGQTANGTFQVTGSTSSGTLSAPRIDYINPSSVPPNTPTWLAVNGANFQNGFTATVAGYAIATPGLIFNSPNQVMVQVTMGGSNYSTMVVIRNPDGQTATGTLQVR